MKDLLNFPRLTMLTDEIEQSAGSKLGNGTSLNNKGYCGLCSQLLLS